MRYITTNSTARRMLRDYAQREAARREAWLLRKANLRRGIGAAAAVLLLALSGLLFLETLATITGANMPCTCDTDSDCMLRCGGDGSPDIEP